MTEASKEDPPAYCAVAILDTTPIIKDKENEAKPLTAEDSPFEDKESRRIFTLKVLSIFLLQTFAVGLIMALVFSCGYSMHAYIPVGALVCSILVYLATLAAMVYCDIHVENRTIYNYVILVIYPLIVAFVIVSLTAFCGDYYWRTRFEFMATMFVAWMCYEVAALFVLFFTIFSLGSKREFGLAASISIATLAFVVTYFGSLFFVLYNDIDPFGVFGCTVFLYIYYLYVLHDVQAMTGRNYRVEMTPDDVIKGAVNLQIDFVYIIKKFVVKCAVFVNDQMELEDCRLNKVKVTSTHNTD